MARTLHIRDFVPRGTAYHVARTVRTRSSAGGPGMHGHDFAEVFWIERGRMLHRINGKRQVLEAGHVVLMRPSDVHDLRTMDGAGFALVNVAFHRTVLTELRQRYFTRRGTWLWQGDGLPWSQQVSVTLRDRLSQWAGDLAAGPVTTPMLHAFLLDLLTRLRADAGPGGGAATCPPWLSEALQRLGADPRLLAVGVPALVKLSGRSIEHISRTMRRSFGCTSTEQVNRLRLEQCARGLAMSERSIIQIAGDAGFASLAHFYRQFQLRFGVTPRRYRLRARGTVP